MRVAFTRLHYGKDYLGYVIASALPFVDKFVVLYTPNATFGRTPTSPCPDTRDELQAIAQTVAGDRLDWHDNLPPETGEVLRLYPDADFALELDADEIIHPALFKQINDDLSAGRLTEYCYRLPFWHHWRSFRHVCEDSGWPARLYFPKRERKDAAFYADPAGRVHHFGYARRDADMRYKWECSMHAGEIRADWWGDIWEKYPARLTDLHPVAANFWDAKPLDPLRLPPVLHNHPYSHLEVIR